MKKSVIIGGYRHFRTVIHHKNLIMKYCFRVGLYKQGIVHDLSKFSYTEFSVGCKYFQGNRSPNNAERENKGYSAAWLHHKGRNKHHYEYWIDYSSENPGQLTGMKMPVEYVVEMFIDRIAASRTYMKDNYTDSCPLEYYLMGKPKLIHQDTANLLLFLLEKLANEGEKSTFEYIRKEILKNES